MARYLKRGMDASAIKATDAAVRQTVEGILADVEARRDAAVRDLSRKFDNWSPASFRLTPAEIERALAQVPGRDLDDIKFAQQQVRNFAQAEDPARPRGRDAAGRRARPPHPGRLDRLLRAGAISMVASAHMSIVTARVAGVNRIAAAARRRSREDRIPPSSRPCASAAPTISTCWAACRRSQPWRWAPDRSARST